MPRRPDIIADTVLNKFRQLPKRFKPRHNGRQEWVPLAGIVLSKANFDRRCIGADKPGAIDDHDLEAPTFDCIALATGMKCHPHNKLPQFQGCVLHDWHAEVLAIRAFNRFLLDECADLAARSLGRGSSWLKWRSNRNQCDSIDIEQPFELQDDVSIHMYVSEAPCGDASMELTMASQEDATPWSAPTPEGATKEDVTATPLTNGDYARGMHGRGHFDQLGKVRRKPSRPDAPATLSKSCSDKLALKQCTGLLSAMTYQFVHSANVYLKSLVLPASEHVPEACERAFGAGGRMSTLLNRTESTQDNWKQYGFAFQPFKVCNTSREFEYSKRYLVQEAAGSALEPVPSNRSCIYTPHHNEVLINGVLEGRRMQDPNGASCVSRHQMWKSAIDVAARLDSPTLPYLSGIVSYSELKANPIFEGRRKAKHEATNTALKGWLKNTGDDDWTLIAEKRKTPQMSDRPY